MINYILQIILIRQNVPTINRGFLRDLEVVTIEVAPIQYLPKSKALIVADGLKVILDCKGSDIFTKTGLEEKQIPVYKALVSNFKEIETEIKPTVSEDALPTPGADILIIAYDSFISSLAPLVNWRINQGYDVEVVGISTIYMPEDDTEDEKIARLKSYLTAIMDPVTGWDPRPAFVLLVGDKAQITPAYFTGTYGDLGYSDYHYSCVVGTDWYSDLAIGRFSASNTTDVTNQVNKTLFYEQNPQAHTGVGGASGAIGGDFENCEDCKIALLMEAGGLFCQTNYNGLDGSNSNTFIHAFNGTIDPVTGKDFAPGTGVITVDTHGNSGVWGGLLSISSVNNATMTNRHYFPIAFISACLCGKFDDEDCIMEKLQTIQGGTIANSGSSVLACGGTSDQLLNIALQGIMGIRPPYHPDRFEYTISPDIGYVPILGQAMSIAKNSYLTYYGNPNGWNVKECMMQYNLFGDPVLMTNFKSNNRVTELDLDSSAVSMEWLPIFPRYTVQYSDTIDGIYEDVPGTAWPIKANTWDGNYISSVLKRFYRVIGNPAE